MRRVRWDQIETDWERMQLEARQAWPKVTPTELEVVRGRRGKLVDKVRDA